MQSPFVLEKHDCISHLALLLYWKNCISYWNPHVITPLSPDLFSWQGLNNFGGRLQDWRKDWEKRQKNLPPELEKAADFYMPPGAMQPLGYIVMRYSIRHDRAVQSFVRWIEKMPQAFRQLIPEQKADTLTASEDPYCIATIKDYFSLMPMAQEARKPMFNLKPGDGAIASNQTAARRCYEDFAKLAKEIIERVNRAE